MRNYNSIFEGNKSNPSDLMKQAIDSISEKTKKVCSTFNVDFSQVETWLIENRSKQFQEAERFFNAINTDVYGKYVAGTLLDFELKAWQNVLNKWRDMWVDMLREYWQANKQKKVA